MACQMDPLALLGKFSSYQVSVEVRSQRPAPMIDARRESNIVQSGPALTPLRTASGREWWADARFAQLDLDLANSLNPTHFMWGTIAETYSVIKLELLKRNPHRFDLSGLFSLVDRNTVLRALLSDALE